MTRKELEKERREAEKEGYKPKKKSEYKKETRKRGKNITKYVRSGGVMRKVSSTSQSIDTTIMEQVKDEYRTTQEVTTPQEQEQLRSKYSTVQERDTWSLNSI